MVLAWRSCRTRGNTYIEFLVVEDQKTLDFIFLIRRVRAITALYWKYRSYKITIRGVIAGKPTIRVLSTSLLM